MISKQIGGKKGKDDMNYYRKLSKNKGLEIELLFIKDFWWWFKFLIEWNRKTDHAGFLISIVLLWFDFSFKIYDNRHWNYKADRYYEPGEETKELEFD